MTSEIMLGLLGLIGPAVLLVLAVRRWLDPLPWRIAVLLLGLSAIFLGRVLVSATSPLPLDSAASAYPIRGIVGEVVAANSNTSETARQVLPWLTAVKEAVKAGRLPLWNRHVLAGTPLLGNGQAAPFSPFFVVTLFVPLPRQMTIMAGLKLFVAMLFGVLLLRREGLGWAASTLGALLFAGCLFQVVFLYYPMTSVTALLPGLLYALSRGADRHDRASLVLLALVTAAMLAGGHPESVLHAATAAVGWLVLEWVAPRAPDRRRPRLAPVAAAVLAGLLLAAPAWLPLLEQIPGSARKAGIERPGRSGHTPRLAFGETALLVDPDHFGHPARGSWASRSNYAEKASFYLGLVPLVLLTPALLSPASGRRDRLLAAAAGLTLLIAADWTPLAQLVNSTPPYEFAANARLRVVVVLLSAVAAARVLDRRDRRDLPVAAAAIVVVLAGWALAAAHRVEPPHPTFGLAALAGLWLAIALAAAPRWRRLSPAALALPLVFVELAAANEAFHPARDEALFAPGLPIVDAIEKDASGTGPFRVVGRGWTLLPDLATHYRLEDIRGADPMASATYLRVLDGVAPRHRRWPNVRLVERFPQPLLDLLNVRYVLTAPGGRLPPPFEQRYSGPDGELYSNPRAVERFFVPRRIAGCPDGEVVERLQTSDDPGGTALVGWLADGTEQPNGPAHVADVVDDGFGGFRLIVDAERPTLVATSLPADRGWRVRLDGGPTPIQQVNLAFVGFTVPAGRTEVDLRYHPRTFDIGIGLSIVGLIALAVLAATTRRLAGVRTPPCHGP